MNLLKLSDLFLDTPHYGSHTVGSEAMYVGLPLLTFLGDSFSSRVGLSLVQAAGLHVELVCMGRKDCVDIAVKLLSTNKLNKNILLEGIRTKLERARGIILFNSSCYAKKLENLYSSLISIQSRSFQHLFFEDKACHCI